MTDATDADRKAACDYVARIARRMSPNPFPDIRREEVAEDFLAGIAHERERAAKVADKIGEVVAPSTAAEVRSIVAKAIAAEIRKGGSP